MMWFLLVHWKLVEHYTLHLQSCMWRHCPRVETRVHFVQWWSVSDWYFHHSFEKICVLAELCWIVYCVFLAGGISARLKITKYWWGLMRFACLMPQGSGGQLTSRQLENLSQQPWRSFCSSIANNQMIWGGRCPVSIKYNKELIKWFWFVWCAVMGVGWMVESGTVSLAFKWQLLEFLIFGV